MNDGTISLPSRSGRLTIGVDIDGVLADIVEQMLPLLGRECGRPVAQQDIVCYQFTEALGIPEHRVTALLEELILEGHYESAPVIRGAAEALRALSHHTLLLVTSRPEHVREQTLRWLDEHGLTYHDLIFSAPLEKGRSSERFDWFVEDNLDTAIALSTARISVMLFDRPWNQSPELPDNVHRVREWSEIVSELGSLACV